jgi:hypothetical protein
MNLLNPDNTPAPQADAALAQTLAAFDTAPIQGTASNVLKANAAATASEEVPALDEDSDLDLTEEELSLDEPSEDPTKEDEGSAFAVEFEQEFGMKPTEAVQLVQELQGFRQELSLMREWQVSPVEYDSRLAQVKEFFGTLPEGERDKFNTAEGAKAIWNHLVKQGQASGKQTPNSTRRAARGVRQATQAPAQEIIKRGDILKMDEATYQRSLPLITKAFREGRVVD